MCGRNKIGRIYKEFIDLWEPIFSDLGYKLEKKGNLPLVELGAITPADIPLSHKKRYKYMDTYFKNSGRYGSYLMRASASTQVSIDYKNEKDMVRKLRILEKISPILMIIMESKTKEDSNLPGITGKPHLHRIQEWDDLDDARTGFLKGSLDEDFNYDKMADIILNTPLILFSKDGNTIDVGSKSAADLVKENIIDVTADSESIKNDIEHVMSMGFFHFRVKKYIEIRVADSVEINKALGYVALIKGLFYDDSNLFALDEKLYNIKTIDEINSAVEEIKKDGLDAVIYKGYTARKWRNILKEIAINSLPENEKRYLEYI